MRRQRLSVIRLSGRKMKNNNYQRVKYWQEQMNAAYDFMAKALDYPVEECGEPLESLPDVAKATEVEVEFAASPLGGKHQRMFYLRRGIIPSFVGVAREMNQCGWVLKIEDGYRSRAMQQDLCLSSLVFDQILKKLLWELNGETPSPEFMFRRITALSATCPKIGTHMSGSAIDISVLNRNSRTEIDRGGPYVEMSEKTPMLSPFVSASARRNRAEITRLITKHGFLAYPYEFWHYCQGDAYVELLLNSGRPARYGAVDWEPRKRAITPIKNPADPLCLDTEIRSEIERALKRINCEKPANEPES